MAPTPAAGDAAAGGGLLARCHGGGAFPATPCALHAGTSTPPAAARASAQAVAAAEGGVATDGAVGGGIGRQAGGEHKRQVGCRCTATAATTTTAVVPPHRHLCVAAAVQLQRGVHGHVLHARRRRLAGIRWAIQCVVRRVGVRRGGHVGRRQRVAVAAVHEDGGGRWREDKSPAAVRLQHVDAQQVHAASGVAEHGQRHL